MTQARAIRLAEFGAPTVMKLETVSLPDPGPGEVRLRQTAIGFNYIDVYQRSGVYPLPLPTGLGHEAAGVVEAVGPGVTDFKAGDRAAYMHAGIGAYADRRNVAADRLVPLPVEVGDEQAAAVLFKGLTAQYLIKKTYAVQPGDIVLVHAAAGGVGQILCRWAKGLGATVIGTASRPKLDVALAAGCDAAIDYTKADWPDAVIKATGGRKARVVYDSVGADTLLKSMDCTAPFGFVVSYGAASGPAPAVSPDLLNKKGCLYLTRPSVFPHNADARSFRANAADLFAALEAGIVSLDIGLRVPLEEAPKAHEAAEARATTGAILLIP
ncbi:quinone oxidoreductase [Oleomonas cavernae]|uniref:Quinone oxidoreductase n=1 Tax=Oleomonas cavernae TaxID=2320859 RepID=A0A418WSY9_9PROT|nr:quinone oxidoreductase [Oleomonas cavernae]RJF94361.1 quinone oxidoreductase [Oleomonas cavernae]